MGEIRVVGTGETRGYPYLVCKKEVSYMNELRVNLIYVKVGEKGILHLCPRIFFS